MATIFVTGATGFVGFRYAIHRAEQGDRVKVLVRQDSQKKWQQLLARQNVSADVSQKIEVVYGDLSNGRGYQEALRGCDAVVHAGAKVGYWGKEEDFEKTNYFGTVNLAEAAKEAGIKKFIYLSSQAAVRPIKYRERGEAHRVGPDTPYPGDGEFGRYYYGVFKMLAEQTLLRMMGDIGNNGFSVVVLRPHIIWGVGDTTLTFKLVDLARSWLSLWGRTFVDGRNIRCASSHIDTVVHYIDKAIEKALELDENTGRVFHVVDKSKLHTHTWAMGLHKALGLREPTMLLSYTLAYLVGTGLEYLAGIIRLLKPNFTPPLDRFSVDGIGREMLADKEKTIKVLGPQPEIDVEGEMARVRAWWDESGKSLYASGLFR